MASMNITKHQAEMLVEKTKRQLFALDMFVSQPHQDAIFTSKARELLVRGGVRAGKSVSIAAFTAAYAMDKELTLSDGTRVRARPERHRGRAVTIWVIGFDQRHIGETIHRLLFKRGAFKVVYDKQSGKWRAFNQSDPVDAARPLTDIKLSPEFIPARYVKPGSWDWERKANNQFNKVIIHDPVTKEVLAEIFAYGSKQDPKQGDPVDYIWIDEAIQNPSHYAEWQSRLGDKRGILRWSSWPRANNSALRSLTKRAQEDASKAKPIAQEIILTTSQNAQLDPEGKEELLAGFTEEQRLARDKGEYLLDNLKMYPFFDTAIHTAYQRCNTCSMSSAISCSCCDSDDDLAKVLRSMKGQPPDDWTRELIMDPGTNHPAVLFCAIPPPSFGDYLVVYDELYPGRVDALPLSAMVKQRVGRHRFNRFIIDYRASRQTPMSFGLTIKSNIENAFKKVGLRCHASGGAFTFGSDNVGARINELRSCLHFDAKGKPKLRIVTAACVNLCKQLNDIVKKEENSQTIEDRPEDNQQIDLHDCLTYWVASRPFYVKPQPPSVGSDKIVSEAMRIRNRVLHEEPVAWGSFY